MKPIINPWFFYFISITNGIKVMLLIFSVIAFFGLFLYCMACADSEDSEYYDTDKLKKIISLKKKTIIISILFLILGLLVPSKKICYQMLILSYVTPNNIEAVKNNTKDIVDYIIDATEEFSNKKEE